MDQLEITTLENEHAEQTSSEIAIRSFVRRETLAHVKKRYV